MPSAIHIGTSGWSYKHWRGLFYPAGLAAARWLPHYSERFGTTEINSSFYRLPSPETVDKWMNQVPEDFLFCPKMSRYLSHMKKLRDPEEPLQRFFSIFDAMQERMGPVLIQLPPVLRFDKDITEHFYKLLKKMYSAYEFVLEVRHPSWLEEQSLQLMKKYDVGFVISQSGADFPYAEMVTARNIYVRFHGPAELYASSYPDVMLRSFARKMKKWKKGGHEVWAFFNNDIHGYATEDAGRLMEMLEIAKGNGQ